MSATRHAAMVLAALLAVAPAARAQLDLGAEFQVNTYTTGKQDAPVVAVHADGSFVVVWQSRYEFSYAPHDAPDDSAAGVFLQRFDAAGAPVGGEQHVNTFTLDEQIFPDVSAGADGKFVVVWTSGCHALDYPRPCSPGGYGPAVALQGFDAAGAPVGAEQVVNAITPATRLDPAVASTPAGDFVVVWSTDPPGYYDVAEISARRFSADGTPAGDEFQVGVETSDNQFHPDVAVDAAGNFVVVWGASTASTYQESIRARRFDASGVPLGEFEVAGGGDTYRPAVAATAGGEFVVVWQAYYPFRIDNEIRARRFAADGTPVGPVFRVNTKAYGQQTAPAVAADAAGNFVVAWTTHDYPDYPYEIAAQAFAHDGVPLGREFLVNSATGYQREAAIGGHGAGEFVVAWSSRDFYGGQDGDSTGIFARRLSLPPCSTAEECDDEDICTTDACEGGVCLDRLQPGCCHVPADCNDYDPCTDEACTANACSNPPIPGCVPCGFGIGTTCTASDACSVAFCNFGLGRCESNSIPGCCLTAADCDDGLACTENACDAEHECTSTAVPDCVDCSEDAECVTGCLIAPETCEAGRCETPAGCPVVTIDDDDPLGEAGKLLARVEVPADVPGKGKIKVVMTATVGPLDPADTPSRRCKQGKVVGRRRTVVEAGSDSNALLALAKAGARCLAADPDGALPVDVTVQVKRKKTALAEVTAPRTWRR